MKVKNGQEKSNLKEEKSPNKIITLSRISLE